MGATWKGSLGEVTHSPPAEHTAHVRSSCRTTCTRFCLARPLMQPKAQSAQQTARLVSEPPTQCSRLSSHSPQATGLTKHHCNSSRRTVFAEPPSPHNPLPPNILSRLFSISPATRNQRNFSQHHQKRRQIRGAPKVHSTKHSRSMCEATLIPRPVMFMATQAPVASSSNASSIWSTCNTCRCPV